MCKQRARPSNYHGNRGKTQAIFIAICLCFLFSTFAACSDGGLNGTYKSRGFIAQSFTFYGGKEVTMSAFGLNISGTYKIDGGVMTITYKVLGTDVDIRYGYSKKGESIFIDGTEFVKQ